MDQYRDHLFASLIPMLDGRPALAEIIKEAEVKDGEFESLPDTAFAWPERRSFPIHNRESAAMSRLYRGKLASVPEHVDEALKVACELYDIPESVFTSAKVAAAPNPEDYLLPEMMRLRVVDATSVKVAEEKLLDGFERLSVEHRAEACSRLIEKAAKFQVKLDPLMHKLAGYTISSTAQLKDWLGARQEAAKNPAHKTAFSKLAAALEREPAEIRNRSVLIKLAETIDELDKRAGLTKFYDRKLPDPLQTVFNTEKVADATVELGGRYVPIERLASFPATFYGDVLGDDFVREASDGRGGMDAQKVAVLLETLPRDMRNALAQQMGPYLH